MTSRVVITQAVIPVYRNEFFEGLRASLEKTDIKLDVLAGQTDPLRPWLSNPLVPPWVTLVDNREVRALGKRWLLQDFAQHLRAADMVILGQENRFLGNYLVQWRRRRDTFRLGFWSHGRNFNRGGVLSESWRRLAMCGGDAWFAYTSASAAALVASGVPKDLITVVNNTLEGEVLPAGAAPALRARLRAESGWDLSASVGVFCGTLHDGKRLDFLLSAADELHRIRPDFRFLIIGDGPHQERVLHWGATRAWVRHVGPKFGAAKMELLGGCDLLLNPYFLGLTVVDAFRAGLPVVALRDGNHSPEAAYVRDQINGIFTEGGVRAYASKVSAVLGSGRLLGEMRVAALTDAQQYSLQQMVERFSGGIRAALDRWSPRRSITRTGGSGSSPRRRRVLVLHPALAQYRIDLFNRLAEQCDLRLAFLNPWIRYHRQISQERLTAKLRVDCGVLEGNFSLLGRDLPIGMPGAIERFDPEVVITSEFSMPSLAMIGLRKGTGRRVGHVLWSDDNLDVIQNLRGLRAVLRRVGAAGADALLLPSEKSMRAFSARYEVPAEKIFVCSVGQDEREVRREMGLASPQVREALDGVVSGDESVLLFVGRLSPEKNVAFLIRAFARFAAAEPSSRLVILGSGPEGAELRELASVLGIRHRVSFPGHLEGLDLAAWYRLASLVILPSQFEPYGAVVNEALCGGIPVLCSDVAGAVALIEPSRNGYTFSPWNAEQLLHVLGRARCWLRPARECAVADRPSLMVRTLKDDVCNLMAAIELAAGKNATARPVL